MDNSLKALLGLTTDHLKVFESSGLSIHHQAYEPFLELQNEAKKAGFELAPMSIFRSFEQQQAIWNAKAEGSRDLLDDQGALIDFNSLSEEELLFRILRWSAFPGMSRHHWGSDLDIIDTLSLPSPAYRVDLTPEEVSDDGIFGPLHMWLDKKIANNQANSFYRPYDQDRGGVAPERWHLSFHPVSNNNLKLLTYDFFKDLLQSEIYQDLFLKDLVIKKSKEIYQRFIVNVASL
jgi:LAS superfamily LD-carboxypeptidase LdcB